MCGIEIDNSDEVGTAHEIAAALAEELAAAVEHSRVAVGTSEVEILFRWIGRLGFLRGHSFSLCSGI
jgi:hypothetical protein